MNVSQTTVVRDAWARGQSLTVHGWIYDLHDGLIRDLSVTVMNEAELAKFSEAARNTASPLRSAVARANQ